VCIHAHTHAHKSHKNAHTCTHTNTHKLAQTHTHTHTHTLCFHYEGNEDGKFYVQQSKTVFPLLLKINKVFETHNKL